MNLYIIPTPIGNLKDMTLRSIEILERVEVILCEDTRTSSVILQHYQVKKKCIAFHQHNEHSLTPRIVQELLDTQVSMALISDAGTPGISDACFLLVRACIQAGIRVECLPGATAFVPALVASGLTTNRFVFEGFLPLKKGRQSLLKALSEEPRTIILYESPKKVGRTLKDLLVFFEKERKMCLARELSKIHETYLRGSLEEVYRIVSHKEPKGELVLIIEGKA